MNNIFHGSTTNISDICDFIEIDVFLKNEYEFADIIYMSDTDSSFDDLGLDAECRINIRIEDIKKMLENRLRLYQPYQPYQLHNRKIISTLQSNKLKRKNLHYLFCLYYSLNGAHQISREHSTLFEKIVDRSLKNYFNTTTSVLTSFGNNEFTIKEKIASLLNDMNEIIGDLNLIPSKAKDGGIDIVTYKSLDNRGNQVIVLTDATLSKNWTSKRVYSKLRHWIEYIHFKNTPTTCLAVAKIIPMEKFHSASKDNGLIFDRTRIVRNYTQKSEITVQLNNWKETLCNS